MKILLHFLSSAMILMTGMLAPAAAIATESLTPSQLDAVERHLMDHPEIIIRALKQYQAVRESQAWSQRAKRVENVRKRLLEGTDHPRLDNKGGSILFAEFFDYQCGYCKRAFPEMMKAVTGQDDLSVVFVEYPVLGPASEFAARAALASARQGKYVAFHTALMEERGRLTEAGIMKTALAVGLDVEQLEQDMEDSAIATHIARNREMAASLSLSGTPAFLIGTEVIPGAIDREQMRELIEKARKENLK